MSYVPNELKYTSSHEWIRAEGNDIYSVGITEHAQALLGELVYIDLPVVGTQLDVGEDCMVIESAVTTSDIYSPIGGEIVAVNQALDTAPNLVNQSPYEEGWLFRIKAENDSELEELLYAEDYQLLLDDELVD